MRSTLSPGMRVTRRTALALAAVPAIAFAHEMSPNLAVRKNGRSPLSSTRSLDGIWKFRTDPYSVGQQQSWFATAFDASHWEDMAVPGVWDVINEHSNYVGAAWYRTEFATDPAWAGKLARLIFDGVYNDATVWLNGQLLGTNNIGYLPFHFDIRKLAPPGIKNQLTVRANNRVKSGAVWNWGGIRRPVSLEITALTRLDWIKVDAEPDLATGSANVVVRSQVPSYAGSDSGLTAQLTISRNGAVVWQSPARASETGERGAPHFRFVVTLPREQVHLWHFNTPHLYEAEVSLLRDGKPVHTLSSRFGIRKLEIAGEKLLLNGESVRTVGFNIVADDRRTGSALPLSRIKADVDMLKMAGANMARLSHQSLPGEFLDYLDEVGMLVIDEIPVWGKSDYVDPASTVATAWLERMIDAHYNHPSIIGWSVGNEIGRLDRNPLVMGYVRTAVARAKALDPTRFAVYISNTASHEADDPVKFSDLIMLNSYGDLSKDIEQTRKLHPGKPIFVSEYGGEVDSEDPNDSMVSGDRFLSMMRGKASVIGASLWTLNDYRSSWPGWTASPATPPSENRSWGVLTVDRRPKRSFFSYRIAHAPLRLSLQQAGGAPSIMLKPRGVDDLPAYPVRGYRLLWRVAGKNGKASAAGILDIPAMLPGGAPVALPLPNIGAGVLLLVDLIDPLGYSLVTIKRDLTPPATPVIRKIHTGSRTVRIVFDPVPRADGYIVTYTGVDGEKRTSPTINSFVDVDGLELDKTYGFRLSAVNGAGESAPTPRLEARTDWDELPPIVWSVQSADRAVFVNYDTVSTDFVYEVELTSPGGAARTITVTTRGVTRIPDLDNGRTYQLRMRRGNALGFPPSEWSEPIPATPRGAGGLPSPASAYIVPEADGLAMLVFEPVEGAAGYEARFGRTVIKINSSASGTAFLKIDGPPEPGSLGAIDDFGEVGAAIKIERLSGAG